MTIVNFYTNENLLIQHLVNVQECKEELRASIDTMEAVCDADVCELFVPRDFYSIDFNGEAVGNIIYSNQSDGDVRDILIALSIVIDKAECCDLGENSLNIGLTSLLKNGTGALIAVGQFDLPDCWDSNKMVVVESPQNIKYALRKFYIEMKVPENYFSRYCGYMFDNIYFYDPPENISLMGLKYSEVISDVIRHFSYLNDFALNDFSLYSQPIDIIRNAGSRGVEISPESPKTHGNIKAMAERFITIDGEKICCEWHTKFQPRQGRIHFYAWLNRPERIKAMIGEKVIVGIITHHLT